MNGRIGLLAAKGVSAASVTPTDLITRGGLDVLALMILVGWLYRRRRPAPEMPLVLTALNIGLFAAMAAISAGKFPAGVGFGLFGILSLVRLRSAAFTVKDVAYTFVALVIALCGGLTQRETWLVGALDLTLLLAVLVVDDPRAHRPSSVVNLTLDRVYTSPSELRDDVTARLGQEPLSVVIDEIDYVRETTRVSVRYPAEDPVAVRARDEPDYVPMDDAIPAAERKQA
jgi:hypothetical protein